MKLFTTIILFCFAFSSQILFAQGKQNDATWEETIAFLNKYSSYFTSVDENHRNFKIKISRETITIYAEWIDSFNNNRFCIKKEAMLKKLKKAFVHKYDSGEVIIVIDFTGNYVSKFFAVCSSTDDSPRSLNRLELGCTDSEILPRIKKALQHLAYLAIEKRKEELKKSGDKF